MLKREDDRRARGQGRRWVAVSSRSRAVAETRSGVALALRVSRAVAALAISLLAFGAVTLSAAAIPHRASTSASSTSALNGTWRILDHVSGGITAGGDMTITASGPTSFSGSQAGDNGAHASVIGSIKGRNVTFREPYTDVPGYVVDYAGTIACDGNSMDGTWSDNAGGGGTWTLTRNGPPRSSTTRGVAVSAASFCSVVSKEHFRGHVLGEKSPNLVTFDVLGHRERGKFVGESVTKFRAMLDITISCRLHITQEKRLFEDFDLTMLHGGSFCVSGLGAPRWNAVGNLTGGNVNPRRASGFAEIFHFRFSDSAHCNVAQGKSQLWTAHKS